ncbi:MAG: PTS sugar transporter subunit IIA [Chlorobiaceae bacterium]|nr:PTS sugar transporter subunit IIA [Chlorobiaceae bacterium]NTW75049.1 PTS sugar transporter subunit IIA [Chlorobiaceae bacterium]
MKIESLLYEPYIVLNLESGTKTEVIKQMLALVSAHERVLDRERLSEDVWKREREMSTGIGKNIALPHAKTVAVSEPVLALATLREEIDFESIDAQPVQIVILLATPETMLSEHLKLLGRITRIAGRDEVRKKLVAASSSHEVLELFREAEKDLPQI